MEGFFTALALQQVAPPTPLLPSCGACGLKHGCRSPLMGVYGKGRRKVLVVGEAPGAEEDREGRPFVGRTGQYLRDRLETIGVDLDRDCWVTNAVVCFTGDTVVQSPSPVQKLYRRRYSGPLVTLHTLSGRRLSGTPNHPILTLFGWVALGLLKEGDDLVCGPLGQGPVLRGANVNDPPATFREKFRSLSQFGHVQRVVGGGVDFHGDGEDGDVDVISPYGLLQDGGLTTIHQHCSQPQFVPADGSQVDFLAFGAREGVTLDLAAGAFPAPYRGMGCRGNRQPALPPEPRHPLLHGVTPVAQGDTRTGEGKVQTAWRDSEGVCQGLQSLPGSVTTDRIVKVKRERCDQFLGGDGATDGTCHVYNLETSEGYYLANGIIVSNCRPKNNELPERAVDHCRPTLVNTLADLKPEVIVPLGGPAVQSLLHHLWKEDVGGIGRWAGFTIPCRSPNAWVYPTWHPSFLLREERPALERLFTKHLRAAFRRTSRPWDPVPDYKNGVEVLLDDTRAARALEAFTDLGEPVAFDYETDALKPDRVSLGIVSCAVSNGRETIAYPWYGKVVKATRNLLRSPAPKLGWNCFSGGTRFLSREFGVVTLREAVGKTVTVLNHEGRWVPAEIRSFGTQRTIEISFSRRNFLNTVWVTGNHEWISAEDGSRITTVELRRRRYGGGRGTGSHQVPYRNAPKVIGDDDDYLAGIKHGIVLGDGWRCKDKKGMFQLRLCGEKRYLLSNFVGHTRSYPPSAGGDPIVYLSRQHVNLKQLPDASVVSDSYLIGFLRGLLATDGTVSKGQTSITNKKEVVDWCRKYLPRVGYSFQGEVDLDRYAGRYGTYGNGIGFSTIYFSRESITSDDLLRPSHKSKYRKVSLGPYKFSKRGGSRTEEVFCAVVPDGHSFTLEGGLVTGNCKFEERWTLAKVGVRVRNWAWDGMLAAHALDNRPKTKSLKFQAFVRLGQEDYDSYIDRYKKPRKPGGNEKNRLRELDLPTLLLYNALDAYLTYRVVQIQAKKLGVDLAR